MAKVLVKIQIGYSDGLVMDSDQAQKLLEIIDSSLVVTVAYDNPKLTPTSPAGVTISSMGKYEVVRADAV